MTSPPANDNAALILFEVTFGEDTAPWVAISGDGVEMERWHFPTREMRDEAMAEIIAMANEKGARFTAH